MTQGRIVEYIDQGKFVSSICLQDKGSRLHLLTTTNREVNLSPKRAILISGSGINIERPREQLIELLRQTEEIRINLKKHINPEELWELIKEESESFNHRYLAQLVFGEDITDDHLSALVRTLFEDHLYFRMKDGRFIPNSETTVEQIILRRREEEQKAERLKKGSEWLKCILRGEETQEPSCSREIIDLLIKVALSGSEEPDYRFAKEMLSRAGVSDTRETRSVLIKMGVWEEDENLDFLRLGTETSFTDRALEEAVKLAERPVDTDREDLRKIGAFTIDGPFTRDFDDAVSLEIEENEFRLGIHISDVSSLIEKGGLLEAGARARGASIYLPCTQVPMFPETLCQGRLSLIQGEDREALSLICCFDGDLNLVRYDFRPSVIKVERRLTYEEANELLETDLSFKYMHMLAQALRKKRMDMDALDLSLPELQVKFEEDSLALELNAQDSPARVLIEEFMILYNWLCASFCRDKGIPALYRSQAKPGARLSVGEEGYTFYVFKQLRKLSPLQIGVKPSAHTGLGLDLYTQCTSPIRRYLDLIMQNQVVNHLTGGNGLLKDKELEDIRLLIEPLMRNLGILKRSRIRYWTLKFLSQNRGRQYSALVLDELKSRYRILLLDFLLVAEIKRQGGVILSQGEEIAVKVKKVDPWSDELELSYA